MLFNSLDFLIFFPAVVALYWILPVKLRNPMLLMASYYFYMNWEPVYALLILFSTFTTWICGKLIDTKEDYRKLILTTCILLNLGILFLYKYVNFAGDALNHLMHVAGISFYVPKFDLLLPVGISFYTFQAIGYIVDVYRKEIGAERNFLTYALFVAFFPQLVAGPIERARNIIPQFKVKHHFIGKNMIEGLKMMIWGYFMKLCIADAVSSYVNAVFNNVEFHNGNTLWLASFFFTFQIFCDFAGYSLIAVGVAKCLDFNLMQNFRQPYLAVNVKEFWRRWHISLSRWMADYVYKPLGGSRAGHLKHHRNIFIVFLLSGLWHGANWTFIAWGAYHGFLQSLLVAKSKLKEKFNIKIEIPKIIAILFTFVLMMFGWVLFCANNINDALTAWGKMLHPSGSVFNGEGKPAILLALIMIFILICREVANEFNITIKLNKTLSFYYSGVCSGILIILILLCGELEGARFIYFQF